MEIKKYKILLFLLIIQSCQNTLKTKETHYFDGKIQFIEYFDEENRLIKKNNYSRDGKLMAEMNFINDALIKSKVYNEFGKLDSEFFILEGNNCIQTLYHKEGKVTGKGKLDKEGNQIGAWCYYDENGNLIDKLNFNSLSKE